MTITINNHDELKSVLAVLGGIGCSDTAPVKEEPVQVKEEPVQVKEEPVQVKEEPVQVKEKPVQIKEDPVQVKEEPVQVKEEPSYQDAAEAVTKLARAKGRDAAIRVLAKYGAAKLPEVHAEDYPDLIAACEEAAQ
jgi:hypothetical protein